MTEVQISSLAFTLTAMSIFILALYIERKKHYSLFAGWDASRISDQDACGKLMCKGLKLFSVLMALGGVFLFVSETDSESVIFTIMVLALAPLMFYIVKARKLYWN